jgi:hypothetical protein
MSIWTVAFWKAAAERAVRAFAVGVLGAGVGGNLPVTNIPWWAALSIGASAAIGSVLISLTVNTATGDGPGITEDRHEEP